MREHITTWHLGLRRILENGEGEENLRPARSHTKATWHLHLASMDTMTLPPPSAESTKLKTRMNTTKENQTLSQMNPLPCRRNRAMPCRPLSPYTTASPTRIATRYLRICVSFLLWDLQLHHPLEWGWE